MKCLDCGSSLRLVALIPFALVFVGVLLAVFGKAFRNFPYQPDESKVFKKYSLPRSHLFCFRHFDNHRPTPKLRRKKKTFGWLATIIGYLAAIERQAPVLYGGSPNQ